MRYVSKWLEQCLAHRKCSVLITVAVPTPPQTLAPAQPLPRLSCSLPSQDTSVASWSGLKRPCIRARHTVGIW